MAKIYATPDFDVTSYDINDVITFEGEIGPGDADGEFGTLMSGGWGDME